MSFREEVMSHETIWAYMYGYPVYNSIIQTKEEQIIEIKTQKLEWPVAPEVASEEFLFV